MPKGTDTSTWTFEDYFAFLLVYAAEADFVIKEAERQHIIEKVGQERFVTFLGHFKDLKDVERIELIYEFKNKYCKTPEDSDKAMAEVESVLKEDEHLSATEEQILISIKRILKYDKA